MDGSWDTVHFDLDCNENSARLHFTIVCLHVVAKPLNKVTSLCSSTQKQSKPQGFYRNKVFFSLTPWQLSI